ncbi:hypothetical protein SBA3_1740020 [Candidatus Sulfopaludibacter sp. SbA3]|nr:hypothetical protein SBA3_1740020 [Candidatus Sulfopaludibacter sp. SbA3]
MDEDLELQDLDGNLVSVGDFGWMEEARQAEGLLRAMSIPCLLRNENILRIDPRVWMDGLGGLCLMVAPHDEARAREVLASRVSDDDLAAQAVAATPEETQ